MLAILAASAHHYPPHLLITVPISLLGRARGPTPLSRNQQPRWQHRSRLLAAPGASLPDHNSSNSNGDPAAPLSNGKPSAAHIGAIIASSGAPAAAGGFGDALLGLPLLLSSSLSHVNRQYIRMRRRRRWWSKLGGYPKVGSGFRVSFWRRCLDRSCAPSAIQACGRLGSAPRSAAGYS